MGGRQERLGLRGLILALGDGLEIAKKICCSQPDGCHGPRDPELVQLHLGLGKTKLTITGIKHWIQFFAVAVMRSSAHIPSVRG